jgi:hypothetical protein
MNNAINSVRAQNLAKFALDCAAAEAIGPTYTDDEGKACLSKKMSMGMWQSYQEEFSPVDGGELEFTRLVYEQAIASFAGVLRLEVV